MSTVKEIIAKASFRKEMATDCNRWRKFMKKNKISMTDAFAAFNEKYPDTLSYDGFYKAVNQSGFTPEKYEMAKTLFVELEKGISEIVKTPA